MQSYASPVFAGTAPRRGNDGRSPLLWISARAVHCRCDGTLFYHRGKTHFPAVDTGRRYQKLFRPHLACMALNPYSQGKSHAEEMVKSGIPGTTGSSPHGRRHATGRNYLTCAGQYDVGWIRGTATSKVSAEYEAERQVLRPETPSRQICG